jgi:hypothetical protein
MTDRPPIPANLRRRVLVESGHRCAIPTCRHIDVDVHHIVPWRACKKHEYENLISLCPNCHRRAHKTEEIDRKSLLLYKANLRFTHDRFSQLEVDLLFELAANPTQPAMWAPFNVLLIKRLIDSKFIKYTVTQSGVFPGGMKASPDYIQVSPAGVAYVDSLGISEL